MVSLAKGLLPVDIALDLLWELEVMTYHAHENGRDIKTPPTVIEFWYLNSQNRPVLDYVSKDYLLMCLGKTEMDDTKQKLAYEKWQSHVVEPGTINYAWGNCICDECRLSVPEAAIKAIKIMAGGHKIRTYDFKEWYVPVEPEDFEGYEETPQEPEIQDKSDPYEELIERAIQKAGLEVQEPPEEEYVSLWDE